MRFAVLIKADKNTEAGVMPTQQQLAEMGQFNEELVKAGVMLAGEGLHPSSKGARVRFSGKERRVIDGPFSETTELIAGFWLWQVRSREEAVEWAKRCPNPTGDESEIELRQIFEMADFGAELTPELREQETRLRAQVEAQANAPMVDPVPPTQGAIPYLIVKGAPEAIAFYRQAFGATEVIRLDAPDGSIVHAELNIGSARFMLTEERPQYGALSPKALGGSASSATFYVPDVDATVAQAITAGATVDMPLQDQFWGDRSASLTDPFGHKWMVATHKEDPSPEQLRERVSKMFSAPNIA